MLHCSWRGTYLSHDTALSCPSSHLMWQLLRTSSTWESPMSMYMYCNPHNMDCFISFHILPDCWWRWREDWKKDPAVLSSCPSCYRISSGFHFSFFDLFFSSVNIKDSADYLVLQTNHITSQELLSFISSIINGSITVSCHVPTFMIAWFPLRRPTFWYLSNYWTVLILFYLSKIHKHFVYN